MPVSKAQQRAVNKYISANYDRINLTIPKGRKAQAQQYAAAHGESLNAMINRLLREIMGLTAEAWEITEEEESDA